ncbi:MAG: rhomboid family intramembrane serine protease [Proteobacteria bacterium]|nr:MAG: rhomboid family intramembrane serine protease [Pseudomonadota bacterium]
MKIPHLDPNYARARWHQWPKAFRTASWLVGIVWLVFLLSPALDLAYYGNKPRTLEGLLGLVSMPFLHANWSHLINNTLPLFLTTVALFGNYPKVAKRILIWATLMTGALVWLFARDSNHIGASGLFYALLSYLFVSGFLKKDLQSMGISLIIAFLYGYMIWGIFPTQVGVSWESHLFGLLTGIFLAWNSRHIDRPVLKDWQLDDNLDHYFPDDEEY